MPGRISRTVNCRKPFFFHQTSDIPVDGSNTQSVYLLLGEGERFVRRQRTISLEKGRANRVLLTRVSSLRWASHSNAIVPFSEIILNSDAIQKAPMIRSTLPSDSIRIQYGS